MARYHVMALVLVVLMLAACSGRTASPSDTPGAPEATPLREQIVVRLWDNPQGFDPATLFRTETENVAFNIYSGLTTYEPNTGEIIPDLAERWDTDDARTWTFHLRKGVQWQGGYGELTSRDVVYSYQRVMDPATASPYRNEFAMVDEVSAPDDYTVVIRLRSPDAGFLHQVASYHQGQVVKQEAVERYGDQYQMNPIGTGPFMLERFAPNSEIVLARHDGYFRGAAKLKRVVYRIIKDDSTAEIALKNREVDLSGRLSLDEALDRLQKDERLTMFRADGNAVGLVVFNTEYEPFARREVRQAVAHAVDLDAIIRATAPLAGVRATNLLPSWMPVYTDQVPTYSFDPGRARALLREAGYADGFSFKFTRAAAGGVGEDDLLFQDYLGKVGIRVEFELVETTVYSQRRNAGDFHMTSRSLPAVSPDTILFSYLHPSNLPPRGLNGARYNNSVVARLLDQARSEPDEQTRRSLYHEVQRIAMTDLPYLPRTQSRTHWPAWKGVNGVAINRLGNVDFWPVTVEAR